MEARITSPGALPKVSPGQGRRLLNLKEAAAVLGVSTASIRRLVSTGKVPAVRLTRRIHVDARDLDRLIEQAKDRIGR